MYHPNVDESGQICLDVLKEWSPACTTMNVLTSIKGLLLAPNTDQPLRADVAEQYKSNKDAYDAKVRETVAQYAQ